MGLFLYNISIATYSLLIRVFSLFNNKANKFIKGRKGLKEQWHAHIAKDNRPVAWFHAASLGEFEQGKPVLEAFKAQYPEHQVFLTFFSPSGYELRKNYEGAELITYLPLDTRSNARNLFDTIKPSVVFFIKYEFWYHYLNEASRRNIPLYCVSALFTPNHIFFKKHGSLHRRMLHFFNHIFVQNQASFDLLSSININKTAISGDTRFDRVTNTLRSPEKYPAVEAFARGSLVMIVGSSWPSDMHYLKKIINEAGAGIKFIIAPHEVHEQSIITLSKGLQKKTARITQANDETIQEADLLIIDTIGMLSSIYQYGDFAYIGGAFGDGLHNILEAVTFGLPVIFGNKGLEKFPESLELCNLKGAFAISEQGELDDIYKKLSLDKQFRDNASTICKQYIKTSTGATDKIIAYLKDNYEG